MTVKLSQAINVEAVSIEHAPRELLLNKGKSALKDFTVTGEGCLSVRHKGVSNSLGT